MCARCGSWACSGITYLCLMHSTNTLSDGRYARELVRLVTAFLPHGRRTFSSQVGSLIEHRRHQRTPGGSPRTAGARTRARGQRQADWVAVASSNEPGRLAPAGRPPTACARGACRRHPWLRLDHPFTTRHQGLIFQWNFAEIPVFFVSASYREKKFRYFSIYFVFKFKIQQISTEIQQNFVSAKHRDFIRKQND